MYKYKKHFARDYVSRTKGSPKGVTIGLDEEDIQKKKVHFEKINEKYKDENGRTITGNKTEEVEVPLWINNRFTEIDSYSFKDLDLHKRPFVKYIKNDGKVVGGGQLTFVGPDFIQLMSYSGGIKFTSQFKDVKRYFYRYRETSDQLKHDIAMDLFKKWFEKVNRDEYDSDTKIYNLLKQEYEKEPKLKGITKKFISDYLKDVQLL